MGGLEAADVPSFAVGTAHVLVGGFFVAEFHVFGVPVERGIGEAGGDGSEEDGFSEGAGVVKVCGGGAIAEDGFDELMPVVIAWDAGHVIVVVVFLGEEDRAADVGQEHGSLG
ncbi:MAG: hypothetical protein RI897_3806, partial [Verrucomicrobiota bacterium]